jgi:hypothetical protein
VTTEFGGLFFLLNVFLALGLYGDFTRPGEGLRGLSPFELMLLLGERWFGKAFKADPLAATLRDLAGLQPDEACGRHFDAPVWTVPDAWLSPWPKAGLSRDEPGFPLADEPEPARSAAWRRRRWFACLALYLKARLARALGETSARAALRVICAQPGRVIREGECVAVHFPLVDHPIALRIAGLDRDPGWIPAAGYFVEFHFA